MAGSSWNFVMVAVLFSGKEERKASSQKAKNVNYTVPRPPYFLSSERGCVSRRMSCENSGGGHLSFFLSSYLFAGWGTGRLLGLFVCLFIMEALGVESRTSCMCSNTRAISSPQPGTS